MNKTGIVLAAVMTVSLCAPFAASARTAAEAAEDAPAVGFWSTEPGVTERPVADGTAETYAEEDRVWQGLPTIAVTPGGRMWCAWQTGDTIEGSQGPNNYDVMYYSDDGGETWSDEYMIWDVPDDSIRLADPRLFYDQFGKLWLVLIRGGLKGTYAFEIKNPDCADPASELEMGEPVSWLKAPPAHRPTILSNGRWITPVEVDTDRQVTYICRPNNETGKYPWTTLQGEPAVTAYPDRKSYGEAQVIELTDGRLMMLSRLPKDCGGGMEISYSSDWGTNWTPYKADNGVPYITPSSKFHIQRLESGAILLITHATTADREQLAAYLSYDDGETYPYMMMLDDTDIRGSWRDFGVSYPEAAAQQGENGEIYIVYDAGRYALKEIRMCIVTEEDIKAGKPVTDYCKMRMQIQKLGGYIDYVSAKEDYEQYITVQPGTEKADILEQLPQTVTLVAGDGSELSLTGTWECPEYAKNIEGRYTFKFSERVTGKAQDLYSLLNVYVTVAEKEPDPGQGGETEDPGGDPENPGGETQPPESGSKGGCGSSLAGAGGGITAALAASALTVIFMGKVSTKRKNMKR